MAKLLFVGLALLAFVHHIDLVAVEPTAESVLLAEDQPTTSADARNLARVNLVVGNIAVGDRYLYTNTTVRTAITNVIQIEDIVFVGTNATRITLVRATEQGVTQNASAVVLAGGLNQTSVTVRLQSAVSRGYNYVVDVWGQ